MLESVRAVAFDLDNTLWDIEPVLTRAEQRVLEWLQEHCPRIVTRYSLEQMREARERLAFEEPHRAYDLTYLRKEALARQALECGYRSELAERAFDIFFAARNEIDPFVDVRPALERLRVHYEIASLSNGNADLERIGLARLFRVSLNAREIGVAKPHPRAFTVLADALGLEPQQILYVGDDPQIDVVAAHEAGLRSAWLNRRGTPWPTEVATPDLIVRDCEALAEVLIPRRPTLGANR